MTARPQLATGTHRSQSTRARGGIRLLGRRFQVQSPWLGSSEAGIFSGLESARLCLRNSRAAFLSVGAPFSLGWELRGRHFSGSESARLCLRNSRAAFASWGAVFQEQRALVWSGRIQRAAFSLKGVIFSRQVSKCSSVIRQKKKTRRPRGAGRQYLPCLLLPPNRLRPSFFAIFFKRLDENPRNFRNEHLRTCPNFHYLDILLSHKYFRYFPLTRNVKVNLGPDGG